MNTTTCIVISGLPILYKPISCHLLLFYLVVLCTSNPNKRNALMNEEKCLGV